MLHIMDRAATLHSSVTVENVLKVRKLNATSHAHKLWRKKEQGLEIFLSQQHLCVGCVVFLHTLQLNTA